MSALADTTTPKLDASVGTDGNTSASGTIDAGPISPVERRKSLEKHLQQRPDAQDLKNRHILLDTNAAPSLQAKQAELERSQNADLLRRQLERRPDREDLVERNILPDSNLAPGLQASQKSLERHMKADQLEHQLQRRPTAEELVEQGILDENEKPGS